MLHLCNGKCSMFYVELSLRLTIFQAGPIYHHQSATIYLCSIWFWDLVFLCLLDVDRQRLGLLFPPRNEGSHHRPDGSDLVCLWERSPQLEIQVADNSIVATITMPNTRSHVLGWQKTWSQPCGTKKSLTSSILKRSQRTLKQIVELNHHCSAFVRD